ncbi:MAG: LiaF transmembrane domain-containing protein [Sphingobacteriaceae bacterium]|jgi:predicted membrane protein
MENQMSNSEQEQIWNRWETNNRRGKIAGGVLIVLLGSLYLARELGAMIPYWVFSWKMFLIMMGLVVGIKSSFKRPMWFVLIAIGSAFLISDFNPDWNIKPIIWPIALIVIGLVMIFKPRRQFSQQKWEKWQKYTGYSGGMHGCEKKNFTSNDNYIFSSSFMGGVKKIVITKDFKGGEISNVFGGAEYDLSQADITETATLEINQVFGGTKLIVPSSWEIKSELVAVFGGIDDKRPIMSPNSLSSNKILILKGTTYFGGIDIRSYS